MGKVTGFMEWERRLPEPRDVDERLRDYKEVYREQSVEQMRKQGGRCMDCGVPFCQQGCPLGNHIPDWNDLIYRDGWQRAYHRLAATNNFPEFTGRLCPAPCESACTLAVNMDPVTIEQNEREIIERAFAEGWVEADQPRQRTGKKIAIVGSGPAGLAAAVQLNSVGHRVKVYEAADRLGGLLRYGIPDFKMEKWVLDRRLEVMQASGIELVPGADVGTDPTWAELHQAYDAVLIAIGSRRPRDLKVPGRELPGVHFAMDFLTRQNKLNAGDAPHAPALDAHGKRVVILGGGDTGSDCVGTSRRHGAAHVLQIELLPTPPSERPAGNPWPQWPLILRTSSSHHEGCEREFALMTKAILGKDAVEGLRAVRVDVKARPGGGMLFDEVPGSEQVIPADMLILAMGFVGPDSDRVVDQLGVELDTRGNIKTDARFATNIDGVFAAGDANRGQSLIVWAISEGREAARSIDAYLRADRQPWLPTRGVHQHFGGR